MGKARDQQFTLSLFDPPSMERELPGFLDCEPQTRHILNTMIANSRKDRYIIAAEMSRDMQKDITHHMINGWTSAKEGNRFPLSYLPAFEKACGSYDLLEFLAAKRGCVLLIGNDAEAANLGRIDILRAELEIEETKVRQRIERNRRILGMTRDERDA
ncbi:MAG: hypothetical protein HQL95_02195 [Magnetococcales bacterium]|nr:hypothetical protein [Magnetococcales bacterium]